jgi:pimeloyl-ACP methyl ester carboxylesterase
MTASDQVEATERLTINGGALAVRQAGDGEPVVLLHPGFVADGMRPLFSEPVLAGYRLIAYHRRGYGGSDPAGGPRSVAEQADDLIELLGRLGIDRAHLVGHSYGGNVAIEVALTAPEIVQSVCLLEPLLLFAVDPATAQFVLDTGAVAYPRLEAGDVAGAVDAWLTGAFGGGFRDVLETSLPGAFAQACRDASTPFGVEVPSVQVWPRGPEGIGRIDQPVISVLGAASTWSGFRQTHEALLSWIPGAEPLVIDGVTHLLQIADPTAVATGLDAFLRRHPIG